MHLRHHLFAVLMAALPTNPTDAYFPDDRWNVTASGSNGAAGTPIALTWSLAADGTPIRNSGLSNLVNYFDSLFNVSDTSGELTQRTWFPVIEESFDRWSQLSGITFVYEPNDDGARLQDFSGLIGARGDVRIGGTFVDGPAGTLAYSSLPDGGDIVVDTGETNSVVDAASNHRRLRNTLMHELGHALGLLHVESTSDALLMEPFVSSAIDGPQLDDIRGIQALYGDPLEKSHEGLGNGTFDRATSLGALPFGGGLEIGTDAVGGQTVGPTETDFVSIANRSDVDFYSFTISAPALLHALLTPLGGVFSQGLEGDTQTLFDANARSNLSLSVFDDDGTTLLSLANGAGIGEVESISDFTLATAGTYYIRITGASLNVQLYQLQLSAMALSFGCCGDYNQDGTVDAADYIVWRKNEGMQSGYDAWHSNFGRTAGEAALPSAESLSAAVPEPTDVVLITFATSGVCLRLRRKTRISIRSH